jgi:dynein heavy chain
VFLAAACVAYVGPFTGVYRQKIIDLWQGDAHAIKLPVSDHFSLKDVLAKPVEVRSWNIAGLPSDEVCVCVCVYACAYM